MQILKILTLVTCIAGLITAMIGSLRGDLNMIAWGGFIAIFNQRVLFFAIEREEK